MLEVLKGHRFGLDGDVKAAMLQWLQQQVKGFFAERIYSLEHQWGACPVPTKPNSNCLYSFV
jgi:hypothetical protein